MGIEIKHRGSQALRFLCLEAASGNERIGKSGLCLELHPRETYQSPYCEDMNGALEKGSRYSSS